MARRWPLATQLIDQSSKVVRQRPVADDRPRKKTKAEKAEEDNETCVRD